MMQGSAVSKLVEESIRCADMMFSNDMVMESLECVAFLRHKMQRMGPQSMVTRCHGQLPKRLCILTSVGGRQLHCRGSISQARSGGIAHAHRVAKAHTPSAVTFRFQGPRPDSTTAAQRQSPQASRGLNPLDFNILHATKSNREGFVDSNPGILHFRSDLSPSRQLSTLSLWVGYICTLTVGSTDSFEKQPQLDFLYIITLSRLATGMVVIAVDPHSKVESQSQ
ncbi:hypothetical protein TWF718_011329 [Orbilia javanica]|uniref:Uncharacterized protein n=1 Tax=Orbilia javanica TaxID=47235 RepID=A0AAN8NNR8_9PEZI